ncbi:hypothetical protein EDC94DRAFT_9395 [Helicostylum pulchrum]|nr:hypothetical protein EDC94DRAFT_9395 [Helicostylum pulchrum]
MSCNNLISLTTVSNLRLEQFRTQHELARNFYDDHEFCPIFHIEEVTEHRERIQKRTSPYPSPSHSPPPSYYTTLKQQNIQQNPHRQHRHHSQQNHHQNPSSSSVTTRAIPIINPSNMAPVSVPVHQQHPGKINTSPSMAQWVAYKNSTTANMTSPTSSNSSISSIIPPPPNYNNNYYLADNCAINYNQQQPHYLPTTTIARAIPIINPATGQAFGQQQQTPNIPPGFYNVSVC